MTDRTLPEKIADQIRRDILRGRFAPGSPLKERETALEMDVSRTPMREAIRILAKEGLVLLRPARSPVIADPSLEEIIDAIDVLRALELLSGELACRRATDEDLERIAAMQGDMAARYDALDTLDLFELDMGFHTAIVEAARNEALLGTYRAYLERLWRARYLSASQRRSRDRVLRQHGDIVAGLQARDPAMVAAAMRAHLEALEENIRARYEQDAEGSGA
ncbi:GntR family transcriptional regulator [Poseidonocella sp. HB161398]|uniref:GntR family transcriptional regulator n=1 Tax=Poseidonocella sp. HB161398 TaxID=2320855 RepID=UPI0011094355|nr:GntR family transcriptional regulator [Poseidonocella sp. HB161398]